MENQKEPSPIAVAWEWAKAYHGKFYAAVVLAALGVAGTMLSYACIAVLIRLIAEGSELSKCLPGCILLVTGYLVRSICSA